MNQKILSFLTSMLLVGNGILCFGNQNTSVPDIDFLEKYDNRAFNLEDVIKVANHQGNLNQDNAPELDFQNVIPASSFNTLTEGNPPLGETTENTEVKGWFDKIFGTGQEGDDGSFFDMLDKSPEELRNVTLPAGMRYTSGSFDIKVAVVKAYFSPDYIQMDMLAKVTWKVKDKTNTMMLGAWGVRSYYGYGWPEVKLTLLQNEEIKLNDNLFLQLNGNYNNELGTVDLSKATYISMDCDGLESTKIFFRGMLFAPKESGIYNVIKNTEPDEPQFTIEDDTFKIDLNVEASLKSFYFEINGENRNEYYYTYKNSDVIVGLKGFTLDFDVNKSNPDFISSTALHLNETDRGPEWQGLYVKEISLFLPSNATNGDSNERAMIAANDMIIDEEGLSVGVKSDGLENLKLQQKLPVQVKSVEVDIRKNEIIKIRVEGQVSPALLKEDTELALWFMWLNAGNNDTGSFNKSFENDGYYVGMAYGVLSPPPAPTVPPTEPVVEITDQTVYEPIPLEETTTQPTSNPETSFIPAKLTVFRSYIFIPKNRSANEPLIEKFEITNMTIVTTGKIEGFKLAIENVGYNFKENSFIADKTTKIIFDQGERKLFNNFPIKLTYIDAGGRLYDQISFVNNTLQVPVSVCLSDKTFASNSSTKASLSENNLLIGSSESSGSTDTDWAIMGGGMFYYDWNKVTDKKGLARFVSRITVPALSADINLDAFKCSASVRFYEPDKDGRSGFTGNAALTLAVNGKLDDNPSSNLTVSATLDFGSTSPGTGIDGNGNQITIPSYRFWQISGSATGFNIEITPGIAIDGFFGSIAYHMTPKTPPTGADRTKMYFDPKIENGLYLNAGLTLNLVKYGKGKAGLFALFSPSWAPLYAGITADVDLMVDVTKMLGLEELYDSYQELQNSGLGNIIASASGQMTDNKDDIKALNFLTDKLNNLGLPSLDALKETEVKLRAFLQFDTHILTEPEIQASAKVIIKAGSLISGNGNIYLLFSKDDVYIHAGYKYYDFKIMSPKEGPFNVWEPITIGLNFGDYVAARASAYFMMGSQIPTKLPDPVLNLGINMTEMGYTKWKELNNKNLLPDQNGIGVAFGAAFSLTVKTPENRFIYGRADVYAGALFNFTRYENVVCKGWEQNTFGLNNWYGEAEVFAGIGAQLQAKAKIGNKTKIVNIAKAELGALLKAEFPNPSWFYGTVWGEAQILNLFTVRYPLEIEFGQKCDILKTNEEKEIDIPIINSISFTNTSFTNKPDDPETVTVFDIPSVEFNYDLKSTILVPGNEVGEGGDKPTVQDDVEYKFSIEGIKAFKSDNKDNIEIITQWDNNKKMIFKPTSGSWLENSTIGIEFYVTMYQKIDGEWVLTPNKTATGETQELIEFDPTNENSYLIDTIIWFKTGDLATTLSLLNVVDTYPVIDQKYFFVNQTGTGHVEIKDIQSYLFKETNGTPKSNITVTFKKGNTIAGNSRAEYLPDKNLLQYNLPSLSTGNEYTLEINNGEKVVLSYQFGTSKYSTFAEKVSNISSIISEENAEPGLITATCEYGEPFDKVEIHGTIYSKNKPLIKAFGLLKDDRNSFYSNIVKPVMDNGSFFKGLNQDPFNNPFPTWENGTEEYEIELSQKMGSETFEKEMITQSRFPYIYDISSPYETFISEFVPILGNYCPDYNDVYDFLIKYVKRTNNFCEYDFPYLIDEHFPVKLTYLYGTENSGVVDFKYNKSTL